MKHKSRFTKKHLVIAGAAILVALIAFSRASKNTSPDTGPQMIPVVIETATNMTVVQRLTINGEIKGLNQADVYPDVPGKILELYVTEGQYVGAGQIVATIDRNQVGMIFMPATVRAPISGIVGKIYVEKGRTIAPSVPVMLIADTRLVEGVLNVPEKDVGLYKIGQEAQIYTESHPNTVFKGYVSRIASLIDPLTRTLEVRLTLVNTDNKLLPGNYADFSITVKEMPNQVVAPFDAVIDMVERKEVFVVESAESPHGGAVVKDNPGTPKTVGMGSKKYLIARQRSVVIGIRDGNNVQILEGLASGERVISMGKENVISGALVRAVKPAANNDASAVSATNAVTNTAAGQR